MRLSMLLATAALILQACGASRPCTSAGDVSWPGAVRGDKICHQKLINGQWLDDGKYVQKYQNGKTAVEGQFLEGKKHGLWIQYDEKGEKLLERVYDHGVESSSRGVVQ